MSNPWFRTYAEFAHDPKVQMMTESLQRRLIMLFCFRCNGDVTLQDAEVTFQLRISAEEWASTKAEFIKRGFIDAANKIINWDKRQFRSDSSRERVARHREGKKQEPVTECNVTVTPSDTEQIQNRTDTEQKESKVRGRASPSEDASPTPEKKDLLSGSSRGTRLHRDWDLPVPWGEWALVQGMTRDAVIRECDKFKDHWIAKSGKDATKSDWQATWRNWIRRHLEDYAK